MMRVIGSDAGAPTGDEIVAVKRENQTLTGTTLVNIDGIGVPLLAGASYIVHAFVPFTPGATGGIAVSFDVDAESVQMEQRVIDNGGPLHQFINNLPPTALAHTGWSGGHVYELTGVIRNATGGDLQMRGSQEDEAPGDPATVHSGGFLRVTRYA